MTVGRGVLGGSSSASDAEKSWSSLNGYARLAPILAGVIFVRGIVEGNCAQALALSSRGALLACEPLASVLQTIWPLRIMNRRNSNRYGSKVRMGILLIALSGALVDLTRLSGVERERESELQAMPDIVFTKDWDRISKWRSSVRPIIPVEDLDLILVMVISGSHGEETFVVSQELAQRMDLSPPNLRGYIVHRVLTDSGFERPRAKHSPLVDRHELESVLQGIRDEVMSAKRDTQEVRVRLDGNEAWYVAAHATVKGSGFRASAMAHMAQAWNPDPNGRLCRWRERLLEFVSVER